MLPAIPVELLHLPEVVAPPHDSQLHPGQSSDSQGDIKPFQKRPLQYTVEPAGARHDPPDHALHAAGSNRGSRVSNPIQRSTRAR
jgi:hypothetical protein